ncbi:MAG: hypothetical protein HN560_03925, partial [Anaerolineae bacterium]|nr:hypothetical protein [Anaerolineae bacterium]
MRRLTYLFLGIFLLVLILSACGVPTSGPQAWLDWPLDNAIVPIAPLTIQAHASDSDGISRFKFEVDGSSIANVKVDGSRLGEASIEWTPPGPGTYLISVQTVDKSGNPGVVATARVTVTSDPTPTPDALFLAETTTPFAESAETTFAKISHIECGPDQTVYIDISIGNLQGILGYSLYSTWIDASVAEVLTEPLPQLVEKRLQITEPIDTIDRQHQFTLVAEIPETSTLLATNIYEPGGRCPGHYQEEVEMAPSDPIAPLVNATQNANCRRGPSLEYDIVTNLLEGQSAEITGRSTDSSWWVINPGTTCWISGAVVDVSGDITG